MRKLILLLCLLCSCIFIPYGVAADGPDYRISSYQGNLVLHEDNRAEYTEVVHYVFESDFKGQLVTLGSSGRKSKGFAIDGNPEITVQTDGKEVAAKTEVTDLGDGYEVKIYNAGKGGQEVEVRLVWHLSNLLFLYQDIAELNWTPISDWDRELEQVELSVTGLPETGKAVLHAHRGYFRTPARVIQNGDDFTVSVSHLPEGGKLELHGYWGISGITGIALEHQEQKKGLPAYEALEKDIASQMIFLPKLYDCYLPLGLLLALVLAALLWLVFRSMISPKTAYSSKARLYEPPADLGPLLVASHVYSVEMTEVDPTRVSSHTALSFDHLIQAGILDLIDRGILRLHEEGDKVYLQVQEDKLATESDRKLLDMAFGQESSLEFDNLFLDYRISALDKMEKKKGSTVRSKGRRVERRFRADLAALTRTVEQELAYKGLSSIYRKLTRWETFYQATSQVLAWAVTGVSVVTGFYLLVNFEHFSPAYLFLVVGGATLGFFLSSKASLYKRDGVISSEGAETLYLWNSFRNMLRDIAHLEGADLASIVLWNRLLVYATLFGYADKVRRVMKIRQIHLDNPSMDSFIYAGLYHHLSTSSHRFASYGQNASQASHFSVSSTGSSGGGFSGGFGGGGGGAF